MTLTVGIDVGLRRLAIAMPDLAYAANINLPGPHKLTREEELYQLQDFLAREVPEHIVSVWLELPYVSHGGRSNPNVTIGMAETVGAVRCFRAGISVETVVPSTWKKEVCGDGRTDKDATSAWLLEHEPELFDACDTEDEIDAMCIGLYGKMRQTGLVMPPVSKPKGARRGRRPAGAAAGS